MDTEINGLSIIEGFIDDAQVLFRKFRDEVSWDERMKSRKTASFGVSYNYSGMEYPDADMPSKLISICNQIHSLIGFAPNNCLMNYYEDGNSKMGYHS